MLERAFAEACATQGIVPGTAAYAHYMVGVHQAQGQSAVDVFRGLFPDGDGRAEAAALSFERSFRTAVDRTGISPVPGAEEAIRQLSESGVRVCLITSLSRRLLGLVLDSARMVAADRPDALPGGRAARLPLARPDAHRDAAARRRGCPGGRIRGQHRQ